MGFFYLFVKIFDFIYVKIHKVVFDIILRLKGYEMNSQWCSITEYSRRLNISEMTVRRRIKSGKLVTKMSDGKYYIDISKEISCENPFLKPTGSHSQNYMKHRIDSVDERQSYSDKYLKNAQEKFDKSIETSKSFSLSRRKKEEDLGDDSEQKKFLFNDNKFDEFVNLNQIIVEKLTKLEESLIEKYTQRVNFLQDEVRELSLSLQAKDHELEILKQKKEDLELLVKILDPAPK